MAKSLPQGSRVAVVTGMLQTEDHRRKAGGFLEAFPNFSRGGEVVSVVEGHDDEQETFQKSLALLQSTKDIHGLYVSTANCLPVCAAVEAAGLGGTVHLITTDLFPPMVPYIENGTITASIHQLPYLQGQIAVRLIVDHIIYGRPFPPFRYLSPGIVLKSNLRLFREIRPAEAQDQPLEHAV
jgi:LacI family transcriptional regulator